MSLAHALRAVPIARLEGEAPAAVAQDMLAVEEPLEIRVSGRGIAVVMRTPGHDRELVAGFLVTEGIVRRRDDVLDMVRCATLAAPPSPSGTPAIDSRRKPSNPAEESEAWPGPTPHPLKGGAESLRPGSAGVAATEPRAEANIIDVLLAPGVAVDLAQLTRHVFTSSSCGLCSKASIEAVRGVFPPLATRLLPLRAVLAALPERLRAAQAAFAATGGLHASALFDFTGKGEVVREDVGRHNALDKVIGHAFFADRLPLAGSILLVSGRVSFEIMQKALAAGISCVAAISAPTSAAVEFAQESGQTLVGFLRPGRMNVYAGTVAE